MHKTFKSFLILIFSCLLVSSCQANALKFETLKPGLELSYWQPQKLNTALHVLRVDLKHWTAKPILAKDYQNKNLDVKEMQNKSGAIAVINANFFDEKKEALGLVLRDGEVLNRFHPTSWWGSLLIENKKASITKVFKKTDLGSAQQGVQAGPILVKGGKKNKLKENQSSKSAVGLDLQGRLYIIVSDGAIEINQLAQILADSPKQGGLGLQEALNLDGGPSTQFYLKTGQKEIYRQGGTAVPVGLGIFYKNQQEAI
ncbi:MAG: phosphodiester glycosidase family protein [Deltaproteobacteria bacterium]|nr:phosphodiester glycosidase family protein [Deltaproteobacteria bacterium]